MAVLGQGNYATPYTFTTLAGYDHYGSWDGTGSAAQFFWPVGLAVDRAGNVYVSDSGNYTIRKMTPVGTNWVVTTLAGLAGDFGSADGTGSAARFNQGGDSTGGMVAVDSAGNLYVGDTVNNTIRKVTPVGTNWVVTTLAGSAGSPGTNDGTGSAARFNSPQGVAVDSAGNLYVTDAANNTIRKVTPVGTNWVVTTLAGSPGNSGTSDGMGSAALFNWPNGVALDSSGKLYVTDFYNSTIRKVTPVGTNWVVTTLAGSPGNSGANDGTGTSALFNGPCAAAVDSAANVYVADAGNNTIRKVTPAGVVTTLAGSAGNAGSADGTGTNALFNAPFGLGVDSAGNLYVADENNNTIRKVTPVGTNWVVTTLAGSAGNAGYADGTGTNALFNEPQGLAVDSAGNLYVAESNGNAALRKVTPVGTNWVVTTLAGSAGNYGYADGTGTNALFSNPWAVAVDSAGGVYLTDFGASTIRKVTPVGTNWVVTTLAGLGGVWGLADGTGSAARFDGPAGVGLDSALNVYAVDIYNYSVRKGFPASSVPAPILRQPSLSAGQFGFGITGLPNLAVDLESSADLSQWQLVDTYVLVGGTNHFASPNPDQGLQFYRGHVR